MSAGGGQHRNPLPAWDLAKKPPAFLSVGDTVSLGIEGLGGFLTPLDSPIRRMESSAASQRRALLHRRTRMAADELWKAVAVFARVRGQSMR